MFTGWKTQQSKDINFLILIKQAGMQFPAKSQQKVFVDRDKITQNVEGKAKKL